MKLFMDRLEYIDDMKVKLPSGIYKRGNQLYFPYNENSDDNIRSGSYGNIVFKWDKDVKYVTFDEFMKVLPTIKDTDVSNRNYKYIIYPIRHLFGHNAQYNRMDLTYNPDTHGDPIPSLAISGNFQQSDFAKSIGDIFLESSSIIKKIESNIYRDKYLVNIHKNTNNQILPKMDHIEEWTYFMKVMEKIRQKLFYEITGMMRIGPYISESSTRDVPNPSGDGWTFERLNFMDEFMDCLNDIKKGRKSFKDLLNVFNNFGI